MSGFLKELKKHWLGWLSLLFFILLFGYLGIVEFSRWSALRTEIGNKGEEIVKIAKETKNLEKEIEEVSSPAFLEKEARAKLNLKAEGEEVFVVVGLENIESEEDFSEVFATIVKVDDGLWLNVSNWYSYFFKN